MISTVATGTAPLNVSSTTVVNNLNSDLLDGQHGSYYAVAAEQNGINATQNTNIVNANTQLKAYTDGAIDSANTQLKSYVDGKSVYIGTSTVAFNRSSGSQSLTGVSIDGTANNISAYTINQNLGTSNSVSFDQVIATNNGNGTNFRIGDDAWIGDVNISNTFRVTGNQNAAEGYIIFGNGDTTALGRSNTGALTYGGNAILHASNYNSYALPLSGGTVTGKITATGSSVQLSTLLTNISEPVTVSANSASGTINLYVTTQSVLYYTSNAGGNFTLNITGSTNAFFPTLNSQLSTGQCITVVFLNTNGATAYYNSSVQVDGTTSGVTTKWQGGTTPSSGNASAIDAYTYTVIKTGNATFTVLASQTKFA